MNEHTDLPVAPAADAAEAPSGMVEEAQAQTFAAQPSVETSTNAPGVSKPARRRRDAEDWMGGLQWLCSTVFLGSRETSTSGP